MLWGWDGAGAERVLERAASAARSARAGARSAWQHDGPARSLLRPGERDALVPGGPENHGATVPHGVPRVPPRRARGMLRAMHLVAVICADADVRHALRGHRDGQGRFHLHPVPAGSMAELFRGLQRLDFAGAVVLDPAAQAEALAAVERSSLDATEVGGADTLTVTPGGIIAEYNLGRAVAAMLAAARWDARGAQVVVLGGGLPARGLARELSSLGAASVALLADSPAEAERTLPQLAAGTNVLARSSGDPLVPLLLEQADLVARVDPAAHVDERLLGPHLTLVDLGPESVSPLRRRAMSLGALTFNRRDLDAYRLELALSHILGGPVGIEPLLELFHAL